LRKRARRNEIVEPWQGISLGTVKGCQQKDALPSTKKRQIASGQLTSQDLAGFVAFVGQFTAAIHWVSEAPLILTPASEVDRLGPQRYAGDPTTESTKPA